MAKDITQMLVSRNVMHPMSMKTALEATILAVVAAAGNGGELKPEFVAPVKKASDDLVTAILQIQDILGLDTPSVN